MSTLVRRSSISKIAFFGKQYIQVHQMISKYHFVMGIAAGTTCTCLISTKGHNVSHFYIRNVTGHTFNGFYHSMFLFWYCPYFFVKVTSPEFHFSFNLAYSFSFLNGPVLYCSRLKTVGK